MIIMMHNAKCIAYLRVSTQRQGRSGLGLEAQRLAVSQLAEARGWTVVEELVEIESGKNNKRPKLQEALAICKAMNATLVVAKLDRLSRNAAFLTALQETRVKFVACDMPEADETMVAMMAVMAQWERKAISKRTREALAAAKARGQQLGAYRDGVYVGHTGTPEQAAHARRAKAILTTNLNLEKLVMLQRVDPQGSMSLNQIANRFNEMGLTTVSDPDGSKGYKWTATAVRRLKQYDKRSEGYAA